ncbi:50S ribosome-binding GTPase [Geosporobacter subterraneus DSM 17957]|uniref:50S ribosome-binding GTPase n=1 Tax=Geosporobacter subterraneus DSM 17957 TaxID=1121919 RepID=A0A1M6K707_9FIRM|nr:GTPase [Geosporobacter subterraneus]SHJ54758.1 50S ribosome-binding GTPase [Geosporobacter subterraneus DSM 17957]
MKKCLIVGKPNVGKTLFMLNFAQYLHLETVNIQLIYYNGVIENKSYKITQAKELLSSVSPFKTMCLQVLEADIPMGKGKQRIQVIDSSGLTDGIHMNVEMRRAMAQTLSAIRESDIILHLFDISSLFYDSPDHGISKVDYQLAEFGQSKNGYVILANKIDLIPNKRPIVELQKLFPDHYVIPISAKTGLGFSEVSTFVRRRL